MKLKDMILNNEAYCKEMLETYSYRIVPVTDNIFNIISGDYTETRELTQDEIIDSMQFELKNIIDDCIRKIPSISGEDMLKIIQERDCIINRFNHREYLKLYMDKEQREKIDMFEAVLNEML